jgi:hypothetical protein
VLSRILVLSMFVALPALADDKPLQGVQRLVGQWTGAGTIKSDGKVHQAKVKTDCVEAAGGSGVRCRWTITGIPNFTYVIDDLWGFSAGDGLVHWYCITNGGEVHDHSGHLGPTGGALSYAGPMKGKTFTEAIKFAFTSDGKLKLDSDCTLGGEPYEAVHLELSR